MCAYTYCIFSFISYFYYRIHYNSSHLTNLVKHLGALFATPSKSAKLIQIVWEAGSGSSTYSFIPCSQHLCLYHNVNPGSIPDAKTAVETFCASFYEPITQYPPFLSARLRCWYCPVIDADQH